MGLLCQKNTERPLIQFVLSAIKGSKIMERTSRLQAMNHGQSKPNVEPGGSQIEPRASYTNNAMRLAGDLP